MTLPQNVKDAVAYVEEVFDDCDNGEWQTIRAHLLSQESEIDRLRANNDKLYREHVALQNATVAAESRLAAADALLREIGKMADGTLCDKVRDYLQGAGDEA